MNKHICQIVAFIMLALPAGCSCPTESEADVLVVGGGVSGTVAAIQAGRLGVHTVLVESGSQLGGTMTTGGVCFPGLFHAWGRQIINGIGWELVSDAVALDGGTMPDFSMPYGEDHPKHQILVNAPLFSCLAEERCIEAGVEIRYYEHPESIRKKRDGWEVVLSGKGSRTILHCRQIVDCTGNASAVELAGLGRIRDDETQPGSLIFSLEGYDRETLDYGMIDSMMHQAKEKGTLRSTDCYLPAWNLLNAHKGLAVSHVIGADSSTSELHSAANVEGRASLMRLLRFLRSCPGLENLRISYMAPETAIRETFRIDGLYQVTAADYAGGVRFEDAVCNSFYPIDLHDIEGVNPEQLSEGNIPTVPFRALVPKGSDDILVAGRAVSSDRRANSALRVQATAMATGQAAGAAAALACINGISPKDLPLSTIEQIYDAISTGNPIFAQ